MGIEETAAVKALQKCNNDVGLALDEVQRKRAKHDADRQDASQATPLDDLAVATLLSMGFEQGLAEAALRDAGGDVEAAMLRLTTGASAPKDESSKEVAEAAAASQAAESDEDATRKKAEAEKAARKKAAIDAEKARQKAVLDAARDLIERELGNCLRRADLEDDVAGATLEEEESLLQKYLCQL